MNWLFFENNLFAVLNKRTLKIFELESRMDRNTLLKTSRATFVSVFKNLIEGAVHQSMESLYYKADKSPNSTEQQHLLDARGFIGRNESLLVTQIHGKLDMLLNRSFQTAYDQFRPSFFDKAKAG